MTVGVESKAYFAKIIADYNRYITEVQTPENKRQAEKTTYESYQEALNLSQSLHCCDPTRLGLLLNFAVFQFEVMGNVSKAIELGDDTLHSALEKVEEVDEETFQITCNLIKLLKENLLIWQEEKQRTGEAEITNTFDDQTSDE